MISLRTYGWSETRSVDWLAHDYELYEPARIIADYGRVYKVAAPDELSAQMSGALVHKLKTVDMPKIGDWVAIERNEEGQPATISAVLPRTSEIVRGQAGRLLDKQVVAANVDLAFIVQPLDHDFSPERLQRYVFQLVGQHVDVVILLNKADKVSDTTQQQAQLASLGVDVVELSALHDSDMPALSPYLTVGRTIVIMGSSGAGKSTLTNRLLGEDRQATQAIREHDSKGRHTTVHRELFVLPGGSMIIDTPGIRELQLWGDETDLEASFPDIYHAIRGCHYSNCTHTTEGRCAIKAGLHDGTIEPKRYALYLNFKQELNALEKRRGFIEERRSQQTRESAKRRHQRSLRAERYNDMDEQ